MGNAPNRVERIAVRKQVNQGIGGTLNALVALSRGDYVALIASEDELEADGIALRVSALQHHPEWLAVFGDCSIIDGAGSQKHPARSRAYITHILRRY